MPLSKIPKDSGEEGASAALKAEREEWESKIVKIGGKKKHIYFASYDNYYKIKAGNVLKGIVRAMAPVP